jgi:hypothetical protein
MKGIEESHFISFCKSAVDCILLLKKSIDLYATVFVEDWIIPI